ncbi:MAG: DUF3372 domain-containing protein, partial [Betaproteobacteria bacterium]
MMWPCGWTGKSADSAGRIARYALAYAALSLPGFAQLPHLDPIALPGREVCDRVAFQEVLQEVPSASAVHAATSGARAIWLNRRLLKWPGMEATGRFRIYHSVRGQIIALPAAPVRGADGFVAVEVYPGEIPAESRSRFRYVADGVVLALREGDLAALSGWHSQQMLLVREDGDGKVLDATAMQAAGAIDDLYAAASRIDDLGVTVSAQATRFRLWAPTARQVSVCL